MINQIENISRRNVIKIGLASLASLIYTGCGNRFDGTGTGVRGLDTPDQILRNPFVDDMVDFMRSEGFDMNLSRAVNPPVISGRYSIAGEMVFPNPGPLRPGTHIWRNQTADNHIDTNYDQITQTGTSTLGEIIRGEGNLFTVYSILNVRVSGCEEEVVYIVDGRQNNNGDVSAVYIGSPRREPRCFVPSAGILDLRLIGPAKIKYDVPNGLGLMALKKE